MIKKTHATDDERRAFCNPYWVVPKEQVMPFPVAPSCRSCQRIILVRKRKADTEQGEK